MEDIDDIIDHLFHLHSGTPPSLNKGGSLRPLVHAAFATLIMYSSERADNGEMNAVTIALRTSVHKILSKTQEGHQQLNFGQAQSTQRILTQWSISIKAKFATDNVSVTNPNDHEASPSFINAVTNMGMQYSVLQPYLPHD